MINDTLNQIWCAHHRGDPLSKTEDRGILDLLDWICFPRYSGLNFTKGSYCHHLEEVPVRCSLNITSVPRDPHVLLLIAHEGTFWNSLPYMPWDSCRLNHLCEDHSRLVQILGGPYATYLASCEAGSLLLHVCEATRDADILRRDYALLCFGKLLLEDGFLSLASRQIFARSLSSCFILWPSRFFFSSSVCLLCKAFLLFYEVCNLSCKVRRFAHLFFSFASCPLWGSHSRCLYSAIFHMCFVLVYYLLYNPS